MSSVKDKKSLAQIIKRKKEHLNICLYKDIDEGSLQFDSFKLNTLSIPDSNLTLNSIDTSSNLFDRSFSYPIVIAGMLGGVPKAQKINHLLFRLASSYNIPMGVGSQKIALLYPETKKYFDFSSLDSNYSSSSSSYPFLISNIGMDLLSVNDKDSCLRLCKEAIDMIHAQAISIHLNLIQELLQPEGSSSFDRILEKIIYIKDKLAMPVIIKEVGMGMSQKTIKTLFDSGISYIDLGGKGGTSWAKVETIRSHSNKKGSNQYTPFLKEGYTTVESINNYTKVKNTSSYCIATGGIRSGVDIFKAISIGATTSGIGLGFLKHTHSQEFLFQYMENLIKELKISMMLTGSSSISSINLSKIRTSTSFID